MGKSGTDTLHWFDINLNWLKKIPLTTINMGKRVKLRKLKAFLLSVSGVRVLSKWRCMY